MKIDLGDLPSEHVYRAFVADFEGAWESVERCRPAGRGNFMFALLAMDFLEWCGRVTDANPDARTRFVDALATADRIYFAQLPAPWPGEGPTPMFPTGREFLWVVFNMVRHSLAHRYVQVDVDLTDMRMRVQITGPTRPIYRAGDPRPADYLTPLQAHGTLGSLDETGHDVVLVRLYPDILFADLRGAADAAAVATLPPVTWSRRKFAASFWDLLLLGTRPRSG
ncbi:MAG: hypothetical protein AABM32_04760 [Chloroflexota bacterium]